DRLVEAEFVLAERVARERITRMQHGLALKTVGERECGQRTAREGESHRLGVFTMDATPSSRQRPRCCGDFRRDVDSPDNAASGRLAGADREARRSALASPALRRLRFRRLRLRRLRFRRYRLRRLGFRRYRLLGLLA